MKNVSDPTKIKLLPCCTPLYNCRTSAVTDALKRLNKKMAETELMSSTSGLGSSVRPAAGGMAMFKANAKMAKVTAMWVPKKRITKYDMDSLLGWCGYHGSLLPDPCLSHRLRLHVWR